MAKEDTPVRKQFLPPFAPCLGEEEYEEVLETLRSGWLTMGPKTQRFEKSFADYMGSRHAVAVSSCTAGLHLALVASGIGPGDEVITTPLTFCSTANVIVHQGAAPVGPSCPFTSPDSLARWTRFAPWPRSTVFW